MTRRVGSLRSPGATRAAVERAEAAARKRRALRTARAARRAYSRALESEVETRAALAAALAEALAAGWSYRKLALELETSRGHVQRLVEEHRDVEKGAA